VPLHELELTVGDVLQIGEHTVTVLDIDNDEVTFRIQESGRENSEHGDETSEEFVVLRPR
jgi:hypothetical protein